MTIADLIRNDSARAILADGFAVQASLGKTTFMGVKSMLKKADAATLAGDVERYKFSLLVPSSALAVPPQPLKDSVALEGKSYLVLSVDTDAVGNLRIHLGGRYG